MKKIFIVSMLISAFAFISCGGGSSASEVRVSGSSSVSPLMIKLAEGFEKENKKYSIIVETSDSTIGVQDTIEGKNNIGMASRSLKDTEIEKVDSITLCNDGLVLIANNNASIIEINKKQLEDLFLNNVAIGSVTKAVSREAGSGTRDAFSSLTGVGKSGDLPATVEILDGTGKIKSAVVSDEQKLGYISLGAMDETVKALSYSEDGSVYVSPSVETVKDGTYKLFRPFNIFTKKVKTISEGTKAFLSFINSPAGEKIILDNGYIPVSK